jgi:hypothetical protein
MLLNKIVIQIIIFYFNVNILPNIAYLYIFICALSVVWLVIGLVLGITRRHRKEYMQPLGALNIILPIILFFSPFVISLTALFFIFMFNGGKGSW